MRIGFLTYGFPDKLTGIGRYTSELTRALRDLDAGLEIVLLNPYPDARHPWYREFEAVSIPSLQRLPALATLGNVVVHRAALAARLDVLHDPCGVAPFLMPTRAYKRVTTVHDAIPLVYPSSQPPLTRLLFHTLIRWSGTTADAIVTVSETSARDLHRHLGLPLDKLHVTPLGVTLPEEAATLADEFAGLAPYLLAVGALHPRKNLARTLEAFTRLGGGARLVIVGPPSWGADATLEGVLAGSRDHPNVRYTGFVDDATLDALYRHATALVFPSLYEGFGLPALEAMARGTPVIASATSSLPEVVGDAGLLVDPTSTDAIASAMRRVLDDADLRRDLSVRGLERAAGFRWTDTGRKTLELYRGLLGGEARDVR